MSVSKRTRFEVFKRDKFTCQYCGRTPPTIVLEADHIVPSSKGGPDDMENLVTSCMDCNRGKSNVMLEDVPAPLQQVMREAAERREQLEAYNRFLLDIRDEEGRRIEELGLLWYDEMAISPGEKGKYVFGDDRTTSVRTFLRKLPMAEVIEAIELAQQRVSASSRSDARRWRYFCGVCWNKIREREGK